MTINPKARPPMRGREQSKGGKPPWPLEEEKIKEMLAENHVVSFPAPSERDGREALSGLRRSDPAAYATYQVSRLKAALSATVKELSGAAAKVSGRGPVLVRVHQPGMTALATGIGRSLAPPGPAILGNAEYVCDELDYAGDPSKYLWRCFCTPVDIGGGKIVGVRFAFREERAAPGAEIDGKNAAGYNKETTKVFQVLDQRS